VLEVPGYDSSGRQITVRVDSAPDPKWIMLTSPLTEIRNKPWFVPQALAGPITIGSAAWSVWAAQPDPNDPGKSRGAQAHARVNEIGSLYLSIAGLLNLMAIIDAAHRASQRTA
jgi:hypothetical protein